MLLKMSYTDMKAKKYIPLPKNQFQGVINVNNKDDNCFIWCLIVHKYR